MLLKKESNDRDTEDHGGVVDTYKLLWKILWLPAVFQYVIVLLTCKVSIWENLRSLEQTYQSENLVVIVRVSVPAITAL